MAPTELRIVVADDHPMVRQGLRQMMEEERALKVVAEATGGLTALDQLKSRKRLFTRSVWLLAGLVFASPAFAQYQFDAWNTDNGLPQNLVKAILQTILPEMDGISATRQIVAAHRSKGI